MGTLFRAAAGTVLGLLAFAGMLTLTVGVNFSQRLDDSAVYTAAFSEIGAYDRIHDEVLVDEALKEQLDGLLGNIEVATHAQVVDVLREVMPPAYLQEQAEDNIGRFTGFLRHEREKLEIYIDLEEPLVGVNRAVAGQVYNVIEDLEVADPPSSACSLESLQDLAAASTEPYSQLSRGELPRSAPSLRILSRECREREFDRWFGLLLNSPSLSPQASSILRNEVEELRQTFVEGDTRGFLKAVADPLVEPVVEDAVAEVRRGIPPDSRINLVEWLTSQPGGPSREDFERWTESFREALSAVNGPVRNIAIVVVVLCSLMMALIHLPRPAAMLRWPGVTLLAGGSVCMVLGTAVNLVAPGTARRAAVSFVSSWAEAPLSVVRLSGDLAETFARQATAGFIPATVLVLAIGAVLIVASLCYGRISERTGRFMPGPGEGGPSS